MDMTFEPKILLFILLYFCHSYFILCWHWQVKCQLCHRGRLWH